MLSREMQTTFLVTRMVSGVIKTKFREIEL